MGRTVPPARGEMRALSVGEQISIDLRKPTAMIRALDEGGYQVFLRTGRREQICTLEPFHWKALKEYWEGNNTFAHGKTRAAFAEGK